MLDPDTERVGREVVDAAIEVHRTLGPGLLESAYEACLAFELTERGYIPARQRECPVIYKGVLIDCGYRLDLVINDRVIIELKAVDRVLPVHKAQLLSYLKLTGIRLGFLMNFHETLMKNGIERFVN